MTDVLPQKAAARRTQAYARMALTLLATLVASGASAAPGETIATVRQLGSRVGPIIGSALACRDGVIVSQTVPNVGGYSSLVLEYEDALAKYFPGEVADDTSLEGYISASLLIEGTALSETDTYQQTELDWNTAGGGVSTAPRTKRERETRH